MLFHVATTVDLRRELGETTAEALKAKERERAAELQGQGRWRHRWRVAGRYANVAILMSRTPNNCTRCSFRCRLFPFTRTEVTALCRDASSIQDGDT